MLEAPFKFMNFQLQKAKEIAEKAQTVDMLSLSDELKIKGQKWEQLKLKVIDPHYDFFKLWVSDTASFYQTINLFIYCYSHRSRRMRKSC